MKPATEPLAPSGSRSFEPGAAGAGGEAFNPFPGLRSFEPDEYFLFFGRDRQIEELVRRLRSHRFVAVLGTSGSGKSSLVRAGLIPALESGAMAATDAGWRVAIFQPGKNPFQNLGEALARVLVDPDSPTHDLEHGFLHATLRASGLGLVDCVRQAGLLEGEKLLVVADQFEEVFRFKEQGDREAAREHSLAFVRALLEATREEGAPIYVVLTMRSDYIGQCMEFPDLPEAINQGLYLVPRMNRDELRSAITGPVAVGGAEIAPSLVVRLLNDIGDNQDQLPILQHALMRTWESWNRKPVEEETITLKDYENVGTMSGALHQHAEEAYQEVEKLPRGPDIAEKLFRALTEKDSEGKGVRRLVPVVDIVELTGAKPKEVTDVVEAFRRRSFLMLREDDVLDLSHESLMRLWARLAGWVEAEAQSSQTYRELAWRAAEYQDRKASLLRDPELELNIRWRDKEKPSTIWAQRYDPSFQQAMLYLRKSELRKLWINGGLALLLGILLALVIFIFAQNRKLEKQATTLARQKSKLEATNSDLRTLRGLAERRANATKRAYDLLALSEAKATSNAHEADEARGKEAEARKEAERQTEVAKANENEALKQRGIALNEKGNAERAFVDLQKAREGEQVQAQRVAEERDKANALAELERNQRLRSLAREMATQTLLPRERQGRREQELAALLAVQAYRYNRVAEGEPEDPDINMALRHALGQLGLRETVLREHEDAVRSLTLGKGDTLLSGGEDGRIYWYSKMRPESLREVRPPLEEGVRSLAFNGNDRLAAGRADGSLQIWKVDNDGYPIDPPFSTPKGNIVTALAFSPRGLLVARKDVGILELWETPTSEGVAWRMRPLPHNRGHITSIAINPQGSQMFTGSSEGALRWNLSASPGTPQNVCPNVRTSSVAISREGLLACGSETGSIRVVDQGTGQTFELTGHISTVNSLSFSPNGEFLASASSDKTICVWDLRRRDTQRPSSLRPIILKGHASWVWKVAFTPDGRLVSGGQDKSIRVWTIRAETLAREICSRLQDRDLTPDELKHRDLPSVKTCTDPW